MSYKRNSRWALAIVATILIAACGRDAPATEEPAEEPTAVVMPTVALIIEPTAAPATCAKSQGLINVSKTEVDRILCDWSVRLGKDSTTETTIYRYTKDVELIIAFRNNKSIGMYVIDQPGLGYTGISVRRVRELEKLIGSPAESIISDDAGIREFGAGDYTSW